MIRVLLAVAGAFFLVATVTAETPPAWFERLQQEASDEELYRVLYHLPKGGDLHNHLGGAAYGDLLWKLAVDPRVNGGQTFRTRLRIDECAGGCGTPLLYFHTVGDATWNEMSPCCRGEYTPLEELTEDERARWLSAMRMDRPTEGRNEFFERIWPRVGEVLDQAPLLAELAAWNMKLADEGVRYVEFQIAPWGRRTGDRLLTDDAFHEVLKERLSRPDAVATGVTVRFQANVLRFAPGAEKRIEESYAFVHRHRDLWVSVNLVGREDDDRGYPLRFLETFRKMRRLYPRIPLAIHAGEADEPNRHVRDTLLLGADRIGHGTNLITDPETLLLMRTGPFAVEVSLVSNQLLDYVDDARDHPFAEYLRLGVPVCLATDDRGMWDSSMTDEYFTAVKAFHLSWDELVTLGRTSLERAFVPEEVKAELLESYEKDIEAFVAEYAHDGWRERLEGQPVSISGYARRHLLAP